MFQPMIAENCDRQPKTVVIQPWPGIGDMIWHLPAIKALAANDPSGQVDLVTNKNVPVRALLGNEGTVCRYFLLALRTHAERKAARLAGERTTGIATLWQRIASVLNLARALRSGKYLRAFVFHQSPRYVLAARLAGIPEVHAYGVGMQNIMLTRPALLSPDEQKLFTQDRARAMLDTLGIVHDGEPPRLHPDEQCVRLTAQLYANFAKPWVGIGIGSARANNIWPPERFAVVADALWHAGYRSLFLLGAAHETGLAQTISTSCRVAKPIIVTDQPLDRAVGLLAQCAFSFSNDSGLMNASVALGVIAYGLSGAAAPNVFSPLLRPIIPQDGFDGNLGASRITVERALEKLREDGILNNQ